MDDLNLIRWGTLTWIILPKKKKKCLYKFILRRIMHLSFFGFRISSRTFSFTFPQECCHALNIRNVWPPKMFPTETNKKYVSTYLDFFKQFYTSAWFSHITCAKYKNAILHQTWRENTFNTWSYMTSFAPLIWQGSLYFLQLVLRHPKILWTFFSENHI